MKFFFRFRKKLGPAIKPTEVTNSTSPTFSTIFSASLTKVDSFTISWSPRWLYMKQPKTSAMMNTPAVPRLTPLMVILPSR